MILASPADSGGPVGKRLACVFAAGAMLLALAVLSGWVFGIAELTSILPGLVSMKPVSALAMALCAISLGLYALDMPRPGLMAAATVLFLGVGTLAEIAFGFDIGIDGLLMFGIEAAPGEAHPGRMSGMGA